MNGVIFIRSVTDTLRIISSSTFSRFVCIYMLWSYYRSAWLKLVHRSHDGKETTAFTIYVCAERVCESYERSVPLWNRTDSRLIWRMDVQSDCSNWSSIICLNAPSSIIFLSQLSHAHVYLVAHSLTSHRKWASHYVWRCSNCGNGRRF